VKLIQEETESKTRLQQQQEAKCKKRVQDDLEAEGQKGIQQEQEVDHGKPQQRGSTPIPSPFLSPWNPGPRYTNTQAPSATVPNLGMSRFLVFQSLQI
jgi:hypothetical protein